ncbi:MAG TPA: DUF4173 domain-containing protein [Sphingomonas sp.]|uniref:DUF4153 domain-containing protein n=1 Tax=Sphingomonas sp. TaxID=28214 RepID=UPI002C03D6B8|nr:DUF4173 domain-containing protein [Sphingomonas sp.]HMI18290.1 DUF4173 domain-containing protein [Sphingomonas sp.]
MRVLSRNYGFLLKIGITILLVTAFDWLFPDFAGGTVIGAFAFLWLLGLILARPAVRRPQLSAAVALSLATLFCVALAYDPGPLAWAMFWSALSIAALLPRTAGFDDAWRWAARLLLHGLSGPLTPIADMVRLAHLRSRGGKVSLRSLAALLALPLIGTALFTALFANANPVIADILSRIQLPTPGQLIEWTLVTLLVWPALRPHRIVTRLAAHLPEPGIRLPGTSLPSVLLALGLFNALFALQNGLDIAFLWSGAALPAGMSMTEYVHRGAYPLIATALLAGFFVITMLRPGTAANPLARRLVALWVAQNVFLVASSALRTIEYIEQFELTAWRIAALAWMALVATGLMLICWRMWFARSARWLINANALTATLVLIPCCFVDLDATAATWNVRHAREVGGAGSTIDLCYLRQMGAPGLLPLIYLEHRPLPPETLDRVRYVRSALFDRLAARQSTWESWTPHGASRLARAQMLLGPTPPQPQALKAGAFRNCDGSQGTAADLTDGPAQ